MYLKIKQVDLNNPFIRQYLGYDKVIKTEPDLEPSTTEVKTTSATLLGSSTVIKQEEQQAVIIQPVVQPVPPILQPTLVYSSTGIPAGLQPMFPEPKPEPNFVIVSDK